MPITATALLRIPGCTSNTPGMRVELLSDAVLLHSEASFGTEPEQLGALIARAVGPQLAQHQDARGIFFLPSVAAPKARSYDALIAEIGEGGMWVPLPLGAGDAFSLPAGLGSLGAMLGSMMQDMPQSLLDAAAAAARGDTSGLSQISAGVANMLGQPGQGALDMASMTKLVTESGLDVSSPAFQQMLSSLQSELERDPEKMQRLAAQLFGQLPGAEGEDEK